MKIKIKDLNKKYRQIFNRYSVKKIRFKLRKRIH